MPRYSSPRQRQFEPVPAGSYGAWLIHFIDLGTQFVPSKMYGDKNKRQIRMVFEIPDLLMADGRPMTQGCKWTASGHENSVFRKSCASWTGQAFTDASFEEFDERTLFEIPCLLNVQHRADDSGGVFSFVAGVQGLPRGMAINNPVNPFLYISLEPEKFDAAALESMPSMMSAKKAAEYLSMITSSPEWAALQGGGDQQPEYQGEMYAGEPGLETENPAPPQQQPMQQRQAPMQRQAPQAPMQQRPMAPQQQPQQRPPMQQRPAQPAPMQQRQAPMQQPAQRPPMAAQQRAQPAPAAPPPRQGGVAQRAVGSGGGYQQRPQQQAPQQQGFNRNDPDLREDEIPF